MLKRFVVVGFMLIALGLGLNAQEENKPLEFKIVKDLTKLEEVPPVFKTCSELEQEDKKSCTSEALFDYISNNLNYPKKELKSGIEGKVYAIMIVEKDGSVRSVEIIKGVSETLDAEVIRVLKAIPDFIPATFDDKPIRYKYSIPVEFNIEKYKSKKKNSKKKK